MQGVYTNCVCTCVVLVPSGILLACFACKFSATFSGKNSVVQITLSSLCTVVVSGVFRRVPRDQKSMGSRPVTAMMLVGKTKPCGLKGFTIIFSGGGRDWVPGFLRPGTARITGTLLHSISAQTVQTLIPPLKFSCRRRKKREPEPEPVGDDTELSPFSPAPIPGTDSNVYSVAGPVQNEAVRRNGAPPAEDEMPEYAQVNKNRTKRPGSPDEPVLPVYAQVDKGRGRRGAAGAPGADPNSDTESIVDFEDNEMYVPYQAPRESIVTYEDNELYVPYKAPRDERGKQGTGAPDGDEQYANVPRQKYPADSANNNAEGYYNLPAENPDEKWYENTRLSPETAVEDDGSEGYYNLPSRRPYH